MIAAGGLIQQAREAGGTVRVVYLTSGDSYTASVRAEQHVARPRGADYRAYGHQREDEARAALRTLGVGAWSLTFLGFPNGGLNRLMSTYWSELRSPYRSPYTRLHRPARSESFILDTEYRGEDLTQEIAEIIGDFKPTMMLVPRPEDQHADHCATWFFVADALGDVTRVHPRFQTDLINYIVHYYSWGFEDDDPFLKPPEDLDPGVSGWLIVPLSDGEVDRKRASAPRVQEPDETSWAGSSTGLHVATRCFRGRSRPTSRCRSSTASATSSRRNGRAMAAETRRDFAPSASESLDVFRGLTIAGDDPGQHARHVGGGVPATRPRDMARMDADRPRLPFPAIRHGRRRARRAGAPPPASRARCVATSSGEV